MRTLLAAALAATIGTVANAGCLDNDEPCETPMGSYHIVRPEGASDPVPAIVFLHGAGGSGASAVRPGGMARTALPRGYAVIGPNGLDRPGSRFGTGWSFHPDRPALRDEMAFLTGVRDDAARRFGIDPGRIILAGFSIGGSMASYIACDDPEAFAAFAPVAGSFWRPHPTDCAGPVRLLHTHGWKDRTVPLEGRAHLSGRCLARDATVAGRKWVRGHARRYLRHRRPLLDTPLGCLLAGHGAGVRAASGCSWDTAGLGGDDD